MRIFAWIAFCFLIVVVVFLASGRRASDSEPVISSTKLTKDLACPVSYTDIAPVGIAYRNADIEALAALIHRGNARQLTEGTTVRSIARDGSMVKVTIESGASAGESCWIPESLLR